MSYTGIPCILFHCKNPNRNQVNKKWKSLIKSSPSFPLLNIISRGIHCYLFDGFLSGVFYYHLHTFILLTFTSMKSSFFLILSFPQNISNVRSCTFCIDRLSESKKAVLLGMVVLNWTPGCIVKGWKILFPYSK